MKLPFFLSGPTFIHLFKLFKGTAYILETAFKSLHFDYLNFFIPNNKNNEKIKKFFHEYVKKIGPCSLLNNCVHGSHRIYTLKSYSETLKKIDEICKLTCEIYDEVN